MEKKIFGLALAALFAAGSAATAQVPVPRRATRAVKRGVKRVVKRHPVVMAGKGAARAAKTAGKVARRKLEKRARAGRPPAPDPPGKEEDPGLPDGPPGDDEGDPVQGGQERGRQAQPHGEKAVYGTASPQDAPAQGPRRGTAGEGVPGKPPQGGGESPGTSGPERRRPGRAPGKENGRTQGRTQEAGPEPRRKGRAHGKGRRPPQVPPQGGPPPAETVKRNHQGRRSAGSPQATRPPAPPTGPGPAGGEVSAIPGIGYPGPIPPSPGPGRRRLPPIAQAP